MLNELLNNTLVKSAVKSVKYPIFAQFLGVALGWLENYTSIAVYIPWLDEIIASGALFVVGGVIFMYDVLKHGFGAKLP